MFGLVAPVLVAAAAFAIDVTAWHRDALHLQGLADRAAVSAAPLWARGDRAGAVAVAAALVAVDGHGAALEYGGAVRSGRWRGAQGTLEIVVSSRKQRVFAVMLGNERQGARAVAAGGERRARLVV